MRTYQQIGIANKTLLMFFLMLGMNLLLAVFNTSVLSAQVVASADFAADNWIIDSKSGRVFAVLTRKSQIVEFDSSGKEVRSYTVGWEPTQIVIKGDKLVVASWKPSALWTIDLKTNKVEEPIPFGAKRLHRIFCSEEPNQLVYVLSEMQSRSETMLFQFDLAARKILSQKQPTGHLREPAKVTMSPDGRSVFMEKSSRGNVGSVSFNEKAMDMADLGELHQINGPVAALPDNSGWLLGLDQYSNDLKPMNIQFKGAHNIVHPELDLVAGLRDASIVSFQRYSDPNTFEEVNLKADEPGTSKKKKKKSAPSDEYLGFDLKNDLLFIGAKTGPTWVKIKRYEQPPAAKKNLSIFSLHEGVVGVAQSLPFQLKSPLQDEVLSVDGCDRIRVENGKLLWMPSADDVGVALNAEVKLKSKSGETLESHKIELVTTHPFLTIDFAIKGIRVTPNGKHALVWTHPADNDRTGSMFRIAKIALIDLDEFKVIGTKDISQSFDQVEVSNDNFFFISRDAPRVQILDQSMTQWRQVPLNQPFGSFLALGANQFAIQTDVVTVYDEKTLQSVWISDETQPNPQIYRLGLNEYKIGSRYCRDNVQTTIRLSNTVKLPAFAREGDQSFKHPLKLDQTAWGRRIAAGGLFGYSDTALYFPKTQLAPLVLSYRYPVAMSLEHKMLKDRSQVAIEYIGLDNGKVRLRNILTDDLFSRGQGSLGLQDHRIATGEGRLVVTDRSRLFSIDIPEEIISKLDVPNAFTPEQPIEVKFGGVQSVKIGTVAQGAKLELVEPNANVKVAEDNTLSVDTDTLWSDYLKQGTSNVFSISNAFNPDAVRKASAAYLKIMGRNLPEDRYPVQLQLELAMSVDNKPQDRMSVVLLVLAPKEQLLAVASSAQKEAEAQVELQKKQDEMRKAPKLPADAEARIKALEEKLRKAEAELDAILKKRSSK